MSTTRLLEQREVAARLGITLKAVRSLIGSRALPIVRLSPRRIRVPEDGLEAYIERHRRPAVWQPKPSNHRR